MGQLEDDKKLIERIDLYGKGLTSAECDMMESFTQRLDEGRPLSEKQRKVAEEIDDRRVA